ncbi:MAG TPA: adenylate cyclase regulatory domain-containing protein [Solirubrobacteraceae bacterium]|jgi:adenylate cyclase|nr:adenylate cyclase regulatory domain-containing protein [Solirubrobacteraceae bacterium]
MGEPDPLLDGLEGEALQARRRLVERLRAGGVPEEELRRAAAEDRLVLLPVERALHGEARWSAEDVAREVGLDTETLAAVMRAAALPVVPDDERAYGERDLEMARRLKEALDAGLPLQGLLDANRVMGRSLAQVAAAMRQMVGDAFLRENDREDEAAERLAAATRTLMPAIGPTLEYFFARHLLEFIRTDVLGRDVLATGRVAQARETAVAFSDLVGFTRLGGTVAAEDLGSLARRLEVLAEHAIRQPVRVVKTIGDAVMLACADAGKLVEAAIELNDAVAAEGDEFPELRTGIALGLAVERDGDLYGHAVNLASRVTGIARPGSVLATVEVRDAAPDAFRWSFAGERRVRGVGEVKLFRARAAEASG